VAAAAEAEAGGSSSNSGGGGGGGGGSDSIIMTKQEMRFGRRGRRGEGVKQDDHKGGAGRQQIATQREAV
jgi:hypothetical protein